MHRYGREDDDYHECEGNEEDVERAGESRSEEDVLQHNAREDEGVANDRDNNHPGVPGREEEEARMEGVTG